MDLKYHDKWGLPNYHVGNIDYIPILKQSLNMLLPTCTIFIDIEEAVKDEHEDLLCDNENCNCHIPF